MLNSGDLNLFVQEPATPAHNERDRKGHLGQYFTVSAIADFMAGMFSTPTAPVSLLDAGAGEGALTAAFVRRWSQFAPIEACAYELDENVLSTLATALRELSSVNVNAQIVGRDFLEAAAPMIRLNRGQRYTHAILNPPYRKIATNSRERRLTAAAGLETVNLYSAFVGLALELMQPGGQLVAIIPRSFCNGPYYKPFRAWLFQRAALRQIHLFGSRKDAFSGDGVLQENVILHLERDGTQGDVLISTSSDAGFSDLATQRRPFSDIVNPDDPGMFVNVPTGHDVESTLFHCTLADLGLDVATGPVVAFRLREHLHDQLAANDVPILYPQHLKGGAVEWPIHGKKPNAISVNSATRKWLMPSGWYVIVKRFSSKEERRRIVATLCDPSNLPGDMVGFENKTNVLHQRRGPLPEIVARGLAVYLNSSDVDRAFRLFSGHTQVNATDLRRMKFPTRAQLELIGIRAAIAPPATQAEVDRCVEGVVDGAQQAAE